jgi:hypothetical protein
MRGVAISVRIGREMMVAGGAHGGKANSYQLTANSYQLTAIS